MAARNYLPSRLTSAWDGESPLQRSLSYLVVSVSILFVVFPLFWMVSTALKPGPETTLFPPTFIPQNPTLEPFFVAIGTGPWIQWFINTGIVAGGATILILVLTVPAAYAVSRRDFFGIKGVYVGVLSTMMIPTQVILLPLFVMFARRGMVDSYISLIVCYVMLWAGFAFFLLHGFFKTLPSNIEEAAGISGISDWKIMLRIILPLAKPGISTTGIFVFVFAWNEFLYALVFMQDESVYTISVGLQVFTENYGHIVVNQMLAMSILASLPVLVLFLIVQEQFVQGITTGYEA